jgi:5-methylcytosine-specific restriction endonuclease McrA
MASRAHRWPADDTPLTEAHGGTKAKALAAVKQARIAAPRVPPKKAQERAVAIAKAQLEQLLSKLPPIPTPRKDRIRPKAAKATLVERREWLRVHREAQEDKCSYCRVPMQRRPIEAERWRQPTLDHVVALSKGGRDSFDNTVAACFGCNNAKGDLSVEEFKADFHALRNRVGAP